MLQLLTGFETYCKAVHLNDLSDLLTQIDKRSDSTDGAESVAAIFLNHVRNGTVDIADLISLQIWQKLLRDAVTLKNKSKSSRLLRKIHISVYAHNFSSIKHIPRCVAPEIFSGLFAEEILHGSVTLRNVAHIIAVCSFDPDLSETMISAGEHIIAHVKNVTFKS